MKQKQSNRIALKQLSTAIAIILLLCPSASADGEWNGEVRIPVFDANSIHFQPDSAGKYNTDVVAARNNGRVIERMVLLPEIDPPYSITAHLIVEPIPKDELVVYDKWDRAGNVHLVRPGTADVEIVKFVTAYGGRTEYFVDVSHLAPLLKRNCTIGAFIDTWVSPAWKVSCELIYSPGDEQFVTPIWSLPLYNEQSFDFENVGAEGALLDVSVPEGADRVMLYYLVSGHCTDGRGADEFESKDNVLSVDDQVVYRFRPWRDDCREFREINPYTRRWSDGFWSSDYSRSGWCPGDAVEPLELDLTDHLTPGDHRIKIAIEDIRPKDDEGHYGYWRISCYLVGFKKN